MDFNKITEQEWYKKQTIENFNLTWDLIDENDRTKKEDLMMIHTTHTSRFHWGIGDAPVE